MNILVKEREVRSRSVTLQTTFHPALMATVEKKMLLKIRTIKKRAYLKTKTATVPGRDYKILKLFDL